jgi:hypothetical protein
MSAATKLRDPDAEQLERDAFSLLQHLHSVSGGDPEVELLGSRAADVLRLDRDYALRVIRFLEREGLVDFRQEGPCVSLTLPGVAYVEHLAWRRRSVRRRWS